MKARTIASLVLGASLALVGCGAVPMPPASSASSGTASSQTKAPAAPGEGGPMIPASGTRVTMADNGKTVTLHVGQGFLLALGDQQWSVTVADQAVVARVPNVMVVRGAQGLYRALKAGTTTLQAAGRPNCSPGQACPMYIIGFHVTLQVLSQ